MMTGFNPTEVIAAINKVNASYEELLNALYGKTQNDFINPMGDIWACRDAQDYFNGKVKPDFDGILQGAFETFQSVVDTMNQAATNWAARTQSEWSPMPFEGELKYVETEIIKENIADNRGIIEDKALDTINILPAIVSESESAVDGAVNAVQTCGFLDIAGAQTAALVSSLEKIKSRVSEVVTEETNSVKTAIANTVEEYGALASRTTDTFTA